MENSVVMERTQFARENGSCTGRERARESSVCEMRMRTNDSSFGNNM
jgi:hypothetical protein